ncbi:MAG: protein-export chaperone SecB [Alphaproteobacteria bacterium]|nr:protein-export chaperone SecB [Alphaproteobacteria bacterium]MAS47416.1 protein-export chaperone SecB [Alphaproteobacteria bacterium]MAX96711.1 protein-export chaperone SecB [Alphaproteobacteria bacterium]MBN52276.1 protein-export chaperone SecB [Alphaproteobacteria bacterium]OUT41079.1 MAG: protein-export chaperone SecB [Micavibrio sp. TMED2]|tara:strand:+ start:17603 stop:18178 length:576 start_codon:yes stop_codon:yes gene_type:complete
MSDATNDQPGTGAPAQGQQGPVAPITILAQYTKDLSFESPKAPASLAAAAQRPPQVEINVDVQARDMQNEVYEVVLRIVATARPAPAEGQAPTEEQKETVFLLDLSYAGLFRLQGLKEEMRKPVLLIEAPRLLFPFAREIMANTSRQGGFPPLLINPVDFADLYRRQNGAQAAAQGQANGVAAANADEPVI